MLQRIVFIQIPERHVEIFHFREMRPCGQGIQLTLLHVLGGLLVTGLVIDDGHVRTIDVAPIQLHTAPGVGT